MEQCYLAWAIPSALSGLGSLAVILNICAANLYSHLYQQLILILAIADFIQSISGVIVNKCESPRSSCYTLELLLQITGLCKAATTVMICYMAWYIVQYLHPISKPLYKRMFISGYLITLFIIIVAFFLRSYTVFCPNEAPAVYLKYTLLVLLPITTCIVVNFCLYALLTRKIHDLSQKAIEPALSAFYITHLLPTLKQLKLFPLCLSICWSMEIL
jgi:hypothetical protein